MAQYLILLRAAADVDYSQLSDAQAQDAMRRYEAWVAELTAARQLVGGDKLADRGGVVLTADRGGMSVRDGPYQETKEVIGGYFILDTASYAHAIELCRGHPNFHSGIHGPEWGCSVEVREIDATD